MSMERYLAAPGISQSALKRLAQSPAHYKAYIEKPEPPTRHQILGTVEHVACFEPERFTQSHYVRPATYTNKKGEKKTWHSSATECKDWLIDHADRLIITPAEYEAVEGMTKSIFQHPAAAKALAEGKAEQSLFCEDAETGFQLRCRCDWLTGNAIVDLKKCQDASPAGFAKSVANYWYDLQAAVNLHIASALGLEKDNFLFIAVEDSPPYAVGVYQLDQASIEIGNSKFRRLMKRYLECVTTEQWPAYSKNVEFLSLPNWAANAEGKALLLADSPPLPALEVC